MGIVLVSSRSYTLYLDNSKSIAPNNSYVIIPILEYRDDITQKTKITVTRAE